MSIPLRMFMGAIKLLQKTTTSSLNDSYTDYYIKALNDFYANGYYIGKVSSGDFRNLKNDITHNIDDVFTIANKLESCIDFISIGNLNTTAFLTKDDKKLSSCLDSTNSFFLRNVKENPINYFTPTVLSKTSDLNQLADQLQQHITVYIDSNTMLLKTLREKHGSFYNPQAYLNVMTSHKFTENEGMKFVEAFVSVYMYGVGSLQAFKLLDQFLELHENHSLKNGELVVDFSYFHVFQDWDKKTIDAYRLNPNLIEFIESLVQPSKRLMLNFTNKESFFAAFKGYFLLQLLSQVQMDPDAALNMYDEYLEKYKNQKLDLILYCSHVIRSFPETNTSLIYNRILECVTYLYDKVPNVKPTYSAF